MKGSSTLNAATSLFLLVSLSLCLSSLGTVINAADVQENQETINFYKESETSFHSPRQEPTSFPSSPPSIYSSDKADPCNYESANDDLNIAETYFPGCVPDMDRGKPIYHQECYPVGYCRDDTDPGYSDKADHSKVGSGYCSSTVEEGLPANMTGFQNIDDYDVCNRGIENDIIDGSTGTDIVSSSSKFGTNIECSSSLYR